MMTNNEKVKENSGTIPVPPPTKVCQCQPRLGNRSLSRDYRHMLEACKIVDNELRLDDE